MALARDVRFLWHPVRTSAAFPTGVRVHRLRDHHDSGRAAGGGTDRALAVDTRDVAGVKRRGTRRAEEAHDRAVKALEDHNEDSQLQHERYAMFIATDLACGGKLPVTYDGLVEADLAASISPSETKCRVTLGRRSQSHHNSAEQTRPITAGAAGPHG